MDERLRKLQREAERAGLPPMVPRPPSVLVDLLIRFIDMGRVNNDFWPAQEAGAKWLTESGLATDKQLTAAQNGLQRPIASNRRFVRMNGQAQEIDFPITPENLDLVRAQLGVAPNTPVFRDDGYWTPLEYCHHVVIGDTFTTTVPDRVECMACRCNVQTSAASWRNRPWIILETDRLTGERHTGRSIDSGWSCNAHYATAHPRLWS